MLNQDDIRKTPLVLIEWEDACSVAGWIDPKEVQTVSTMTVGYLVFEDKEKIIISSTINSLGHVSTTTIIPKGWIKKRVLIKKKMIKKRG